MSVQRLSPCSANSPFQKRKRREYRQVQRARFTRPDPGFSLYEGRTRGKRMRYTFDDDGEDFDEMSTRRSTRNSDRSTPADGPTVTASGRTVRPRGGGSYGETLLSGQVTDGNTPATNEYEDSEMSDAVRAGGRGGTRASTRLGQLDGNRKRKTVNGYNEVDGMSEEEDAASSAGWNSADNAEAEEEEENDGGFESEDEQDDFGTTPNGDGAGQDSLVVKLKVPSFNPLRNGTNTIKNASGVESPRTSDAVKSRDISMADVTDGNETARMHPLLSDHDAESKSALNGTHTIDADRGMSVSSAQDSSHPPQAQDLKAESSLDAPNGAMTNGMSQPPAPQRDTHVVNGVSDVVSAAANSALST